MTQVYKNLPSWDKCDEHKKKGKATPLEIFICNNEPAGIENSEQFRKELAAVIEYVLPSYLVQP
ncbi:MAG: hypothetical protein KW793_04860 [Candidatus Doudnabacteria bacterium]|nr:hypothetical protein [Candidatus Doudnabacteria bacterium]